MSWRDCEEWSSQGLTLSTTNNQTCKLYDACLHQFVGWYDDKTMGGIEHCFSQMMESDPNFLMGKALAYGMELIGTCTSIASKNSKIVQSINALVMEAERQAGIVTTRELDHVMALKYWSEGNLEKATDVWEKILLFHPTDVQAIVLLQATYFWLGQQKQMRDSVARVLPEWNKNLPLYNYLYGIYAFALVEMNQHLEAENYAKQGLDMNRRDGNAIHSLAHVYEMTGQFDKGISFFENTINDWDNNNFVSCHFNWHLALYHIESGNFEAALELFDTKILPAYTASGATYDSFDASSLLYRLQLEDVNVVEKWSPVSKLANKHKDNHMFLFNDAHILMAFLGNGDTNNAQEFLTSVQDFTRNGSGDVCRIFKESSENLLDAIRDYDVKSYTEATNSLQSVKYKLDKIGGSNAQRDVFNILLLNTAVRSATPDHIALARSLMHEREAGRRNSPLTERLRRKLNDRIQVNGTM